MLAAGSVAAAFKVLLIDFARETGNKVEVSFGPVGALQARLKKGESPDVIVLTAAAMEEMEKAGSLASRKPCRTRPRHGRHRGARGRALARHCDAREGQTGAVAARSIAYPNPAGGGTAGVWFVNLMERLGIAEEVKKKAQPMNRGFEIAGAVARRHGGDRRHLHQRTAAGQGPQGGRAVPGIDRAGGALCGGSLVGQPAEPGVARAHRLSDPPRRPRDVQGHRIVIARFCAAGGFRPTLSPWRKTPISSVPIRTIRG